VPSFLIPEKETCLNINLALENVTCFYGDEVVYVHSEYGPRYVIKDCKPYTLL